MPPTLAREPATHGTKDAWFQTETAPAQSYEEDLVPNLFAPWADRLVQAVALEEGEAVLDVACGTGAVARAAAPWVAPGGSVVGTDVDPGMLAVAREAGAGIRPAIQWHPADAAALPFEDDRFDVVFCQQGIQFMPDPERVLCELHRVLRRGGRLAFSQWRDIDHNPGWRLIAQALDRHVGPEAGEAMRAPFRGGSIHVLRRLAATVGFRDVLVRIESRDLRIGCVEALLRKEGGPFPFSDRLAAMDGPAWNRFLKALEDDLIDHRDDDGYALPMQSHVVIAMK